MPPAEAPEDKGQERKHTRGKGFEEGWGLVEGETGLSLGVYLRGGEEWLGNEE